MSMEASGGKGSEGRGGGERGTSDARDEKGQSPPPTPAIERRRMIKEKASELRSKGLAPAVSMMPPKLKPGTVGQKGEMAQTNAYEMSLADIVIFHYQANVYGRSSRGVERDLSKRAANDYLCILRKQQCAHLLGIMHERHAILKKIPRQAYFYDGGHLLFTVRPIEFGDQKEVVFGIKPEDWIGIFSEYVEGRFVIAQVKEGSSEMKLNDLSCVNLNLPPGDQQLMQFINIATSQYAVNHPDMHVVYDSGLSYLTQPWQVTFRNMDGPVICEGKYVGIGGHKSTQAIEGSDGFGGTAFCVVIDTAKTAFHSTISALEKARTIVHNLENVLYDDKGMRSLNVQFKGLYARVVHGRKERVFRIADVEKQTARGQTFNFDGKDITVENYFAEKYGITLHHPLLPLLSEKTPTSKTYYPMELVQIEDYQRVSFSKQTPRQLREMRDPCIVPPSRRVDSNRKIVRSLYLNGNGNGNNRNGVAEAGGQTNGNPYLAAAGIKLSPQVLKVPTRLLYPPILRFAGNGEEFVQPKLGEPTWQQHSKKFLRPATLNRWVLVYVTNGESKLTVATIREFGLRFFKRCMDHGMKIVKYLDVLVICCSREEINRSMVSAKKAECEFVLFIEADSVTLHDFIKDAERRHELLTQDVRASRVVDVVTYNKWQTLDNIVAKTNIKLGGLNYDVKASREYTKENILNGARMFVGVTVSQTPREDVSLESEVKPPSVVGIAHTGVTDDLAIVGDYAYQKGRRNDIVDTIEGLVPNMMKRVTNNGATSAPKELVIYRGGVSTGDYDMLVSVEIPLWKKAMQDATGGVPPITYIAVHQKHHTRLVPEKIKEFAKAPQQNLQAGTVIDTCIVHPCFTEFYLTSHRALQGTAKTPRYTVLLNEANMDMNELQEMTFYLCFAHQIVGLPTSLPSPLYIAGGYADRGRRVFNEEHFPAEEEENKRPEQFEAPATLDVANEILAYHGTALAKKRFNA